MSSKNSSIGLHNPSVTSTPYSLKEAHTLSGQSKCAIVACVVGGVAGVVVGALGGINLFGAVGSIGFIASIVGGGALVLIALGGVSWIVVTNRKEQTPVIQPNTPFNNEMSNTRASHEIPENTPQTIAQCTPNLAPQLDKERKYNEQRDRFRIAARERMERKPVASVELLDCQEPEFGANAREAFGYFYYGETPPESPVRTFGGGQHACVATDKIPGRLFKKQRGGSSDDTMAEYVERADRARKICEANDLYLLYVPKSKVVDFKPSVVLEEKAELLDGGWESQRACYQWAVYDPQLQSYIKEIFRQLTIFICLMGLADAKYDNVPLTKDGRVALFDLDESGAVIGLTRGCAKGKDGLFNMIPLEWFDAFIELAKQHLKADDFNKLQEYLPKLKEKANKRHERVEKLSKFYNSHHITLPTQPLIFDKKLFKGYKAEVVLFAEKAVERFNQQISSLPHLSMVVGRKISIETNVQDEFFKAIVKDRLFSSKPIWYKEFEAIEKEGLKALQEQGYILSSKANHDYFFFSVIC